MEGGRSVKISIIVPVYNVEGYLPACLESILAQTFSNFEVILINDGSTDRSAKICREFAQKDERIRLVTQENKGQVFARNRGLDYAQGEYITFVDADDRVAPHYLAARYEAALAQDAEVVVGEYYRYEEEGNQLFYHIFEKDKRVEVFENNDFLSKFSQVLFTPVWGKLFKADLFKYVRFPNLSVHEDNFVIQKLYLLANRVAYVVDNLYCYQTRLGSMMRTEKSLQKIRDYVTALEEQYFDLMLAQQDLTAVKEMYQVALTNYKNFLAERELTDTGIYLKICQRLEMIAKYGR